MDTLTDTLKRTLEVTGVGKLIQSSLTGTKQYGNFYNFLLDQVNNALYVLWLGFTGACMMILINLSKPTCPDGGTIDNILPDNLDEPPYCANKEDVAKLSFLMKIFSYRSDFPYGFRLGSDFADLNFFSFFGGMAAFLFAISRSVIKSGCFYIHEKLNWTIVDVAAFYVLPTAIYYILFLGVIPPFFFFVPNLASCLSQHRAKFAYIVAFQMFYNPYLVPDVETATVGTYIMYVLSWFGGALYTMNILPNFSWGISFICWAYLILFFYFLPVFILCYSGMTTTEFFKQLGTQISTHWASLTIVFLFFSINNGYRNLDENIAFGMQMGCMGIILFLLVTSNYEGTKKMLVGNNE